MTVCIGRFRRSLAFLSALALVGACSDPEEPVVPSTIAIAEGDGQQGLTDAPVRVAPSVVVSGDDGRRAAGVVVEFSVTSGGGEVIGASATTDGDGIARVGSWILGPQPGANALTAESEGLGSVTFNATALTTVFDPEVRYPSGAPTPAQESAFDRATARWRSLVIGDLPDIQVTRSATSCHPAINETIDDVVIFAVLEPIDGEFGILGQAGPCLIRSASGHTIVGLMRFDTADLPRLEANGTLDAVILHEMAHVFGFGALWADFGLLADPSLSGGVDPHFTGSEARAAFDAVGGAGYSGAKVPVANTGGPGSADVHWRESVFESELLTPFISGSGDNPLSRVTVASLEDMGYITNPSAADLYTLASAVRAGGAEAHEELTSDVLREPIYTVGQDGTVAFWRAAP